jgi:predicted lipoprotein with Yx(FWY)xxD motif
MWRLAFVLIVLGVTPVAAGCGSGASSPSSNPAKSSTLVPTTTGVSSAARAQIATRILPRLGTVLTNGQGHTLYLFIPDNGRQVTCVSTCAQIWPPVKLANGQQPVVSGQAKPSLAGSDPDPEGGRVVTYAGWPLYTYIGDSTPGSATGQGLNANGGLWYVLSPSGQAIKTPAGG